MKKLVIAITFIAFSIMTAGCEDPTGVCPHGVCKQKYDNPTAIEKEIPYELPYGFGTRVISVLKHVP